MLVRGGLGGLGRKIALMDDQRIFYYNFCIGNPVPAHFVLFVYLLL